MPTLHPRVRLTRGWGVPDDQFQGPPRLIFKSLLCLSHFIQSVIHNKDSHLNACLLVPTVDNIQFINIQNKTNRLKCYCNEKYVYHSDCLIMWMKWCVDKQYNNNAWLHCRNGSVYNIKYRFDELFIQRFPLSNFHNKVFD